MATIFSRIIAGEIPSYKIAEDDKFLRFWILTQWPKDTLWWCRNKKPIIFLI